jgi:hypothetical protein
LGRAGKKPFKQQTGTRRTSPDRAAQADLPCGGDFAARLSADDINIERAIATVSERRREISLKPEGKLGNQAMDHPTRTQRILVPLSILAPHRTTIGC